MTCKICHRNFASLAGLHKHVSSAHQRTPGEYYHTFCPRYDLHDKELIVYKDYAQYHNTDFNSRESFAAWLAANYADPQIMEYCWQKVKERMTKKGTTTMPAQAELKSIFIPTISGFEKIHGTTDGFITTAQQKGVRLKYDYSAQPVLRDGVLTIFCDTREQRPLEFGVKTEKMKLSAGDYTCDAPLFADVFIERKSLSDLAGTLGKGRARFEEELIRAKELGFYLVVVVEDLYADVLNYSPANTFARKTNGAHIFHEIRSIMTQHNHVQFVFAGSRQRAVDLIKKIFRLGKQVRHLDLEYLKDKKLI